MVEIEEIYVRQDKTASHINCNWKEKQRIFLQRSPRQPSCICKFYILFQNSCNLSEVLRSICIGLLCVQERPEDRQSMPSVVQMLGNDSVLPEAKRPVFFTGLDILRTETHDMLDTTNEMSITVLEAR
ncbi:hypothetical protein ACS0TY_035887 [Phlomoides rotata]